MTTTTRPIMSTATATAIETGVCSGRQVVPWMLAAYGIGPGDLGTFLERRGARCMPGHRGPDRTEVHMPKQGPRLPMLIDRRNPSDIRVYRVRSVSRRLTLGVLAFWCMVGAGLWVALVWAFIRWVFSGQPHRLAVVRRVRGQMSEDECRAIRRLYDYGATIADLADDYQVAQRVIQLALLRTTVVPLGDVLPSCLHRAEYARLAGESLA